MPRTDLSHEDLMVWMRELPQPNYPWPFMINPSCTITNKPSATTPTPMSNPNTAAPISAGPHRLRNRSATPLMGLSWKHLSVGGAADEPGLFEGGEELPGGNFRHGRGDPEEVRDVEGGTGGQRGYPQQSRE